MRKISREELVKILAQHELWLESGGSDGVCAVLSRIDLRGADFRSADISNADFRGANLRDADPREANLRGADFTYADLRDAKFDLEIINAGSIHEARFTSRALPLLSKRPNWEEERRNVHIPVTFNDI